MTWCFQHLTTSNIIIAYFREDDDNRVILLGYEEHQQDYINASYVDVSFCTRYPYFVKELSRSWTIPVHMQGYSRQAAFIATQG